MGFENLQRNALAALPKVEKRVTQWGGNGANILRFRIPRPEIRRVQVKMESNTPGARRSTRLQILNKSQQHQTTPGPKTRKHAKQIANQIFSNTKSPLSNLSQSNTTTPYSAYQTPLGDPQNLSPSPNTTPTPKPYEYALSYTSDILLNKSPESEILLSPQLSNNSDILLSQLSESPGSEIILSQLSDSSD
jgi:hypothetical protein